MANQKNAFYTAYLRDSGGEDQDLSVDQQHQAIQEYCHQHGYILSRVFRDLAAPGSSVAGRDAFHEMIQYFRSGQAAEQGVIVWKYSRFAREIDDSQYYKADLRRMGYEIISLKDNVPEGLNGRFFEAAVDWMNAKFLEDLSHDVKRGLNHIVSNHGAVPGTPPRGFMREPIEIGKRRDGRSHILHRWVPDPQYEDLIRLAFQMRAEGKSVAEIHKTTRLYGSLNSYSTFFRNMIYKGVLGFGDQIISDYCDPIVDPVIWDQVQDMMEDRKHLSGNANHPRRAASEYLLSGLAYCAECGSPLSGSKIKSNKKKAGQANLWFYYECSAKQRKANDCKAQKIPCSILEEAVYREMIDFIFTDQNIALVQSAIQEDDTEQRLLIQQTEYDRQLSKIATQLEHVTDAIANMGHSTALLQKLRDLEIEQREIYAQSLEIERQLQKKSAQIDSERIKDINLALKQTFHTLRVTQQREILKNLIKKITVERQGRTIHGLVEYYLPKKLEVRQCAPKGVNSIPLIYQHPIKIKY